MYLLLKIVIFQCLLVFRGANDMCKHNDFFLRNSQWTKGPKQMRHFSWLKPLKAAATWDYYEPGITLSPIIMEVNIGSLQ